MASFTVSSFDKKAGSTEHVCIDQKVINIERDNHEFVTLYGRNVDGKEFYVMVDQQLIDMLTPYHSAGNK